MSLNCFFGVSLARDAPQSPPIPAHTVLFLSQACLAANSKFEGRVTLYAQGLTTEAKHPLCTLHAGGGVYHCPLQLLFHGGATFSLEAEGTGEVAVHLTGYYEAADAGGESSDEEGEEDEM